MGSALQTLVCACSNTSAHRVALFSPSASEPVLVSFTSLPDQIPKVFRDRASFFRVAPGEVVLFFFSKRPTFLPVAGLLSSRFRPDCKTLLPDYLPPNTPFTHRGPQTTRGCQFSPCFCIFSFFFWLGLNLQGELNIFKLLPGRKQREQRFG